MSAALRQTRSIRQAVRDGLSAMARPEPMTLVEWANENFYLSTESSYVEGSWDTLPFQVAIMNAIGHPDIEIINLIKSKRVGYSQMIRAALGYFVEHKKRHQIIYQPTESAAEGFMKKHVEPMIRDVPLVKALAPWIGKKHRNSTLSSKLFSNGKNLWCLGGKSPANFRELSSDVCIYDELAAFDDDIGTEGSATSLGDGRLEGSAFPKSIRGSTPKKEPDEDGYGCQITVAGREALCSFKFHLPCPHCDQEQVLKWGGHDCEFGIKWLDGKPETAAYLCEHCACLIQNNQLMQMELEGVWRCEETGTYTTDGITYSHDGQTIEAPASVTFHIWSAYNPLTTWKKIVEDWLKFHKNKSKLKTFINTVLGETWKEEEGEKMESESLYARREHYACEIPVREAIVTVAVDVQDDRFEIQWEAWVEGEENYKIAYRRMPGDLSRSEIWNRLHRELQRKFTLLGGEIVQPRICLIDSGGHYTDEVYKFSKKHGLRKYVPLKGHSQPNKPIASWPRKRNDKGVYLTMIGTDTGKELMTDRLRILEPGEGYVHFPIGDEFDEEYFIQLTNERCFKKLVKGKWVIAWDAGGRRNEPWDLSNYNLAAIRLLQQHFGVTLTGIGKDEPIVKKPKRKKSRMV